MEIKRGIAVSAGVAIGPALVLDNEGVRIPSRFIDKRERKGEVDRLRHSATAEDNSFDVDIEPNARARVVVKTAGTIRYICKYHPSMQGQLVVQADP